jgi:hypothetical protein
MMELPGIVASTWDRRRYTSPPVNRDCQECALYEPRSSAGSSFAVGCE